MYGFGDNFHGQLATGRFFEKIYKPVKITTLSPGGTTDVCAGFDFSCFVDQGNAVCAGNNNDGQVGDGTGLSRNTPAFARTGVDRVYCGHFHACARMTSGALECWGRNSEGALGIGSFGASQLSPVGLYCT
jgi:alpha-tubulin suppressor-like RCC1 family protein